MNREEKKRPERDRMTVHAHRIRRIIGNDGLFSFYIEGRHYCVSVMFPVSERKFVINDMMNDSEIEFTTERIRKYIKKYRDENIRFHKRIRTADFTR